MKYGKKKIKGSKGKKMGLNPFFKGMSSVKPEADQGVRKPLSAAKKRAMATRPI